MTGNHCQRHLASTLALGKFLALQAGFPQDELEGVADSDFRSFAGMKLGIDRDMVENAALRAAMEKSKAAVAAGGATLSQKLTSRLVPIAPKKKKKLNCSCSK